MSAGLSGRQQLAQGLRNFIQGRGGWVTSSLPLEESDALRFEVRSHAAADVTGALGKAGFAVRFLAAGLQRRPGMMIELIREGPDIVGERRYAEPCAIATFEIRLPTD